MDNIEASSAVIRESYIVYRIWRIVPIRNPNCVIDN